jgi:hypothetical protein
MWRSLSVWTIALALAAAPILAQTSSDKGRITLSGSLRTRAEAWDWFEGDADNAYVFSGSYLRLAVSRQTRPLDWYVEATVPFLLGLPDDAVAPGAQGQLGLGATYFAANDRRRNAALPFIRQASVRFKNLGGSGAQSLRIGRFEFVEGSEVAPKNATLAAVKRDRVAHRLIGHFGFTHVWRSLDGVQYVYDTPANNLTVVGARPTRGVFQVDGWGGLKIGVLYAAYTRQLGSARSAGDLRLFGIYYGDGRRDVVKTDNRPLPVRRADNKRIDVTTMGGHYIHSSETASGIVDVLFWGALQTGSWGVQAHRAGAVAAEAGYQPPMWPRMKPWFRAGYYYGSGDANPDDGTHNTFFQVLPTARWLSRFPFYNQMNNRDVFGQVVLRPGTRLGLRAEVHALRLAQGEDLWYQGGGAFQPWTFGYIGRPGGGNSGLATVADISADYRITSGVSLVLYLGNAWGRRVIENIYPRGKDARFGYVELSWRF